MIAIPGDPDAMEATHSAKVTQSEEPAGGLLEKVTMATPMTPEELEAQAAAKQARRRIYSGAVEADKPDWDESGTGSGGRRISGYFIGSIAMGLTLLLVLGAYFVRNSQEGRSGESSSIVGGFEANLELEKSLEAPVAKLQGEEEVIDSVDQYAKFDLQKIDDVVKKFLTADTVEERAKLVRDPARVKPLMKDYYGGDQIDAEGYQALNRTQVSYRQNFLNTTVRTGDFLSYPIAVARVGDGEDAEYVVDWESWTGYCEFFPEEAREKKPVKPFLVRCVLRGEDYYNYVFSDDQKWSGHQMSFRGSHDTFQAYTAKGTEVDKALQQLRQDGAVSPYVLKVRYPEDSRADDQVEIVEVICVGWIVDFVE